MSCGVGHRHSSDPTWLWPWHGLVATAPIGPLAWEPPYVAGVALKREKDKKKGWGRQQGDSKNSQALSSWVQLFRWLF